MSRHEIEALKILHRYEIAADDADDLVIESVVQDFMECDPGVVAHVLDRERRACELLRQMIDAWDHPGRESVRMRGDTIDEIRLFFGESEGQPSQRGTNGPST